MDRESISVLFTFYYVYTMGGWVADEGGFGYSGYEPVSSQFTFKSGRLTSS
jgi:hypothetical protein